MTAASSNLRAFDNKLVTLVIPCFNEEARLRPQQFGAFLRDSGAHLLFVDDGSCDGTADVLAGICGHYPSRASVLRLPKNVGKAEAVRQGMLAAMQAGSSFVGFWDADLATPLEAVNLFLHEFEDRPHVELVTGARVLMLGRAIERQPVRHYVGRVFASVVSTLLGLPVYDSQCGAKLFRVTKTTRSLFAAPFISRWVFDVEILARLIVEHQCHGGSQPDVCVRELPLPEWKDIKGSKIGLKDARRVITDLWKIHRWLGRATAAGSLPEAAAVPQSR